MLLCEGRYMTEGRSFLSTCDEESGAEKKAFDDDELHFWFFCEIVRQKNHESCKSRKLLPRLGVLAADRT